MDSTTSTVKSPGVAKLPLEAEASNRQSRESQTVTLSCGRVLGFAEYGAACGTPIFHFHGFPSSRLEGRVWHAVGKKLGLRFISVDRPGVGLSSYQPDRELLDWPADIRQLAQHLNLKQYRVLGTSGGGPYALACARLIPKDELLGVGVMAGMGPFMVGAAGMIGETKLLFKEIAYTTAAHRMMVTRRIVPGARDPNPEVFRGLFGGSLKDIEGQNPADRKEKMGFRLQADITRECYKRGAGGYMEEGRILTSPWGFELEDVPFENIKFWYGTDDVNTPPCMGETHTGIFVHAEEMLKELLQTSSPRQRGA